jgi:hypothetical protein
MRATVVAQVRIDLPAQASSESMPQWEGDRFAWLGQASGGSVISGLRPLVRTNGSKARPVSLALWGVDVPEVDPSPDAEPLH